MDRCAMLVDAGYLLGAAGTLLGGSPDRGPLQTDYPGLVQALIVEAELQTGSAGAPASLVQRCLQFPAHPGAPRAACAARRESAPR